MGSLALPFGVEVGFLAVRSLNEQRRAPLPSELLSAMVVFGFLGLVAVPAPKVGALAGWGIVIATIISSRTDILGPVGKFLGGGVAKPSTPAQVRQFEQRTTF